MLQRNGNIGGMWLVRECAVVQLYFVSCIPYFGPPVLATVSVNPYVQLGREMALKTRWLPSGPVDLRVSE